MKKKNSALGHVRPGRAPGLEKAKEHPLREILSSVELRRFMPLLAASSLLSNLLALALPLSILQIYDRIISNKSLETLAFIVIGVVLALMLEEMLRSLNGVITSWLAARFEHRVSLAALDRLMRVPMQRYNREEASAYAEKVLESSKVAELYSGNVFLVLLEIPFVLIFLSVIAIIGGWLVLVPIGLILVFTYLVVRYAVRIREQRYQRHAMDDSRFSFISEVLANIQSVRILAMEGLMQRRYERLQDGNAKMVESLTYGNMVASDMGIVFSQIMVVSVIFAGASLVIPGGVTPGALAACMLLSLRSLRPLLRGLSSWLRYQSYMDAKERLGEIMGMPYEENEGKPQIQPVVQSVELINICLRHGSGASLFSDLSLMVKSGECVAIQGVSGSGKTSLMSVLYGLLQPDSGKVLLDGRPIEDFDSESIHKQIAFLPQNGTVVVGTILENMTMFDDRLNDNALKLAEQLGLDRIVESMKMGYETLLGDGASETLPEGVIKIITIIRALAHEPSVILFDEANLSLDLGGDKLLRDYLADLKGKRIMVLITHRPSILALADQIYSLVDGRLMAGSLENNQVPMDDLPDAANIVAERPGRSSDLPSIVRRQFEEESDLSVCLLPLLHSLHWKGQPRELAEALPHFVQHLDLSGLCSVMANLEWMYQHFDGTLEKIDQRLLPCLFVSANKPAKVVLERLPGGRLRVFDSGHKGETEIDATAESGEIYLFRKKENDSAKGKFESNWFGALFWSFRRHIAFAFVLTLAFTLLNLSPPLFIMAIYNKVLPASDIALGGYLLVGVFIAIALSWYLRMVKGKVMSYLSGRIEFILGNSLFKRVLSLSASSSGGASVSRQVGRIKELESLRIFFQGPMASLAFDIPAVLILIGVIAIIDPMLLIVIAFSLVTYLLLWLISRPINKRFVAQSAHLSSQRWDFLNEALTNMRALRLVGARKLWMERYKEISAKATMSNFRNQVVQSRISSLTKVVGGSTGVLTLALAAVLVINGEISGGSLMAIMMLVWRVTGPIQNAVLSAASLVRVRGTMNQVENLMRLKGESESGVHQTIRPEIHGTISFSRVSFRYSSDADPALLGVTLSIKAGQLVVISGPNGAGKTTLLKLLDRVYVPQAGIIRLDNIDIRQLNIADLRSRISYMPQTTEVFFGTVAQNLLLADPSATDAEVRWAAEMAGLMDDVQALPKGLDTHISNSLSDQMPQGLRQRLSLARTMLKPASVILLDEPGAGMDQSGEEALLRCIQYLRGRATVLVVSHRPSHMRLADTVIRMGNGSVTAMGSFDQIADKVMAEL